MKSNIFKIGIYASLLLLLASPMGYPQEGADYAPGMVQITELMANNQGFWWDEDGDESDWLELFNPTPQAISLEGWYLTDNRDNLTQWAFPAVTLAPGAHRVVFCSSKDRTDPAGKLHTNFKLNDTGEYLGLIAPDGQTIVFEYSPQYPDQMIPRDNYSFGLHTATFTFVPEGAAVQYRVPSSDSLGSTWMQPGFDASGWNTGKLGLGFGSRPGVFHVQKISANLEINHISTAEQVVSDPTKQRRVVTEEAATIDYLDNQDEGHFPTSRPFPGSSFGANEDDFVVFATTDIVIPRSGTWTFGISSDDGSQLKIDGKTVIYDPDPHAVQDSFGSVDLAAGIYPLEFLFYERGGGAEVELFAAEGRHTLFNSQFKLIGDSANGGLSLDGFGAMIQHEITEMQGTNASVYLRIPFAVAEVDTEYLLSLRARYNDGFIAYINGQEVAWRNAPATPAWNASAASPRSGDETIVLEEMQIPVPAGFFIEGENILAIHAFNASKDDADFLFDASLGAVALGSSQYCYFPLPTPGQANGEGVLGFVEPVLFSVEHGFYEDPITVTLACTTPGAEIRYTLDGSMPTAASGLVYTGPVSIQTTTCLRAAAFIEQYDPSPVTTQTYLYLNDVIRQTRPANYPTTWSVAADYDMDPKVVNDARYRNTIKEDLRAIPTLSIVMDINDLFGRRTGIYSNPLGDGITWERPASTELIHPDGTPGFQINNGIRIQGGYSRSADNKKYSFRLLFKREYGPSKLKYPLFGEEAAKEFDTLTLRGSYNYSWHSHEGGFGSSIGKADYIRDEFSRRLQLATGQPASHGEYVHVYLNGLYWGLYNVCERPDDAFAASYMGGNKDDWDCVTSGSREIGQPILKGGTMDAWNEIFRLVESLDFRNDSNYQTLQQWVDVDNIIDYMLTIYFAGNRDAPTVIGGGGSPWNFYTDRRRLDGAGLKAFCWDSEWTLEEPTRNVIDFHNGWQNPARIFQRLRVNAEFRMRVADHIQRLFFNGGPMTVEGSRAIYQSLCDRIDRAIVGESARWGDKNYSTPRTRDDHWLPETERILNDYLVQRSGIVLNQLIEANLYPTIGAPEFNQGSGKVDPGFALTMHAQMIENSPQFARTPILSYVDSWKYEQSGTDLGSSWRWGGYDDSAWSTGKGLFYVETNALPEAKNTPLKIGNVTYYFRTQFELDPNSNFENGQFELQTIVDDGAVVYINGKEVHRLRVPTGTVSYGTFASSSVGDASYDPTVTLPSAYFKTGTNSIAVEVHQTNANSSDVVFGLALTLLTPEAVDPATPPALPIYYTTDGTDPRLPGGAIHPAAVPYSGALPITQNTKIAARTFTGSAWSALTEGEFVVNPMLNERDWLAQNLQITELMYDPADGTEYEFIELHNASATEAISLTNVAFTNGITYTFPTGTSLAPGEYILMTGAGTPAAIADLRFYYNIPNTVRILGPYDGKLSNSGESLELKNLMTDTVLITFTYSDGRGWYVEADGAGHSLIPTLLGLERPEEGSLSYGGNWRPSTYIKGSPGKADPEPVQSLVINEIMANTSNPSNDWIELYNPTDKAVALSGWYLSDDLTDLKRWAITPLSIPAGGRLSFDEISAFNNPVGSGFGLSKDGEELFLSYLPGRPGTDRVVDAFRFKAQEPAISWGRYPDGAPYFYPMTPSRNQANGSGLASLVVTEIMYAPKGNTPAPVGVENPFEYIELFNPTEQAIPLWNFDGSWRMDGDIAFTFPAQTLVPAQGFIVLTGFDPSDAAAKASFVQRYSPSDPNLVFMGPFTGKLSSNVSERIAIERPQLIDQGLPDVAWAILDEVIYFSQAPWTVDANNTGYSLQRIATDRSGNDPANWQAAEPRLGSIEIITPVLDWTLY